MSSGILKHFALATSPDRRARPYQAPNASAQLSLQANEVNRADQLNPARKQEHNDDDQENAEDTDTAVAKAVAVAAEAPAEATEQEI